MPIERPLFPEGALEKKPTIEVLKEKPAEKKPEYKEEKPVELVKKVPRTDKILKKLELKGISAGEKINSLLELAFTEGEDKATEEARTRKFSPYILDAFHDELVRLRTNIPNIDDRIEYIKKELRKEELEK